MRRHPHFFPISALLLLLGVIYFNVLFLDQTIIPTTNVGMLPGGAYQYPYESFQAYHTRDPVGSLTGDLAFGAYVKNNLLHQLIPFWNPYQGLGQPFLAEGGSAILYPPNWLRLVLEPAYWDVLNFLHLFLTGYFVFLFASICGIRREFALFSGAALFAIGWFQGYLTANSIIHTTTWIPLLWYGVERAFRNPDVRWRWVPIVIATYGLGTAGHPAPAIVGIISFGLYVLIRCLGSPANLKTMVGLLPAFFLAIGLAAPQWVQFLHYAIQLKSLNLVAATLFFQTESIPTVFFPFLYGMLNINDVLHLPVYWNLGDYWGLGWVPASVGFPFLAAFVLGGHRKRGALLAVAGVCLITSLWLFEIFPFDYLSSLPFLWRISLKYLTAIPMFAVCVLAGDGLYRLSSADRKGWLWVQSCWWGLCLVLLGLAAYVFFAGASLDHIGPTQVRLLAEGAVPGVAWAFLVPVALRTIRFIGPAHGVSFLIAAFGGVVLSAISYFPAALPQRTLPLRLWGLGLYILLVAVLILWKSPSTAALRRWVAATLSAGPAWLARKIHGRRIGVGLIEPVQRPVGKKSRGVSSRSTLRRWGWLGIPLAGIALHLIMVSPAGLPHRYNIFTKAPFLKFLEQIPEQWRSYSIGGYLFPDLASSFAVSSINNLGTLLPSPSLHFIETYLDQSQWPNQFEGMRYYGRLGSDYQYYPSSQFLSNRRYWDYVGVKYVVAGGLGDALGKPGRNRPGMAMHTLDPPLNILSHPTISNLPVPPSGPATGMIGLDAPFDLKKIGPIPFGKGTTGVFPREGIDCAQGPFTAIQFMISTYARINPGELELEVLSGQGSLLARSGVNSEAVIDNAPQSFFFPRRICADGTGTVQLRLTHRGIEAGKVLAIWGPGGSNEFTFRRVKLCLSSTAQTAAPPGVQICPAQQQNFNPQPLTGIGTFGLLCPSEKIGAVNVMFSTYQRSNPGRVALRILDKSGQILAAPEIDSATLADNAPVRFPMPDGICKKPGSLRILEVQFTPGSPDSGIALWRGASNGNILHTLSTARSGEPSGQQPYLETGLDCRQGAFNGLLVSLNTQQRTNPGVLELQIRSSEGGLLTRSIVDMALTGIHSPQLFILPRMVCNAPSLSLTARLLQKRVEQPIIQSTLPIPDSQDFTLQRVRLCPAALEISNGAEQACGAEVTDSPLVFKPGTLRQTAVFPLRCPEQSVLGVELFISTYARTNPGRLHLTVFNQASGLLEHSQIDSATLRDNQYARFELERNVCTNPGDWLSASIRHESAVSGLNVVLWQDQRTGNIKHNMVEARKNARPPLKVAFSNKETGAEVWENPDAQPRAYLAPESVVSQTWNEAQQRFAAQQDLRRKVFLETGGKASCPSNRDFPSDRPTMNLVNFSLSANQVRVALEALTPGTLTIVDSFMPGWKAQIDGNPTDVFRVNGTFRGVCIKKSGPHEVVFTYRPPLWDASLIPAGLGGLMVLVLVYQGRRRKR